MNHSKSFVEVLLGQVCELRKDHVPRASQSANQDAACEETSKSHFWRTRSAIAPDQCKVRWLSKGNSALRGRKSKTKEGLIGDILHLKWSAIKEGLSNGLEGVGVEHVGRAKEEDIVNVARVAPIQWHSARKSSGKS